MVLRLSHQGPQIWVQTPPKLELQGSRKNIEFHALLTKPSATLFWGWTLGPVGGRAGRVAVSSSAAAVSSVCAREQDSGFCMDASRTMFT